MAILGKILKFFAVCVVLAAFLWLSAQLFFPKEYQQYAAPYISRYISTKLVKETVKLEREKLVIAFAQDTDYLDPTSMDFNMRNRLLQIYEPLVQTDRFFNIIPALASGYGQIDDTTWEFAIRRSAQFHNGKFLTVDDVIASVNRAKNSPKSQMKNLTGGIDAEVKDSNKIIIKTDFPDPLILQKLSFILIMPKDFADQVEPVLAGTGPYRYLNRVKNQGMDFARFDSYWGDPPAVKNLQIKIIPDKETRIKALTSHEIDVLGDVPPAYIESLNKSKIDIKTMPSYEVAFLLFNMNSRIFSNKNLREAAAMAIDKKRFMLSTIGYAKQVSQFVSSGVFGFNQNIQPLSYDIKKAAEATNKISEFESIPIKFIVSSGMADIGKDIAAMLRQAGFGVSLIVKDWDDFEKSMEDDSMDVYLLGWKSDMGDAQDFVQSIVHTKDEKKSFGMYNAGRYSNAAVDKMIEESMREMNISKRLKTLHEIMKTIVEDDVIGVPLFETQVIYGVNEGVRFEPRADGYILAKDIK